MQGNGGGGGGSQNQPKTYFVGTTPGAPTAGTNTWTLADFENRWVVLIMARSITVDLANAGDGSAFITKELASTLLTINNYLWNTGDILTIILLSP